MLALRSHATRARVDAAAESRASYGRSPSTPDARVAQMTVEADRRTHLNIQIDLLVEREMTLILRILNELSVREGVPNQFTAELQELLKDTNVREIADKLDKALPST